MIAQKQLGAWLLSLVHRMYEFEVVGIRYICIITNLIASTGITFSERCDSDQGEMTIYVCNNRSTRVTTTCICYILAANYTI